MQYEEILQVLASLGVTGALSYFLANFGRDLGKSKENGLWDEWGGPPTSQLLSLNNDYIDKITKKRYHTTMSKVLNGPEFSEGMTEEEAEAVFRAWTKILITKTRDTKSFPLLFKENISYGFRRNLWGMKPLGLAVSIVSLIGVLLYSILGSENAISLLKTNSILLGLLFSVSIIWIFVITKQWVRTPAFAYAERLLESIDHIEKG